ncbi:hypothetical protein [Roseibium aggregatum]|jgi:hypothetical protein|uniref:hypothetical protein n=1 Tax=Roseibium aggregatum TaxID=187304 RepID=UPI001E2AA62E|nr:hypothetical protein [Roseibium aggregatum]UES40924.1 hypothetical protein GFC08_25565 [Roseibium aggregatum]
MSEGLDPGLVKWLDAKFDSIAKKIDESDRRASDSRKDVYVKLEEQGRAQLDMRHELEAVKKDMAHLSASVESTQPTLAEFANWKAQAVGAGRLGRFFWITGGFVLLGAAWLVSKWDSLAAAFRALNGK